MVRVDGILTRAPPHPPSSPFPSPPAPDSFAAPASQHDCFQVFKSDVGPDGKARDELDVACAVDHPNLTKALGIVRTKNGLADASGTNGAATTTAAATAAATGAAAATAATGATAATAATAAAAAAVAAVAAGKTQWLVMERVVGKPLAEKPDFSSVLRCRWGPGRRFEPVLVLAVLLQVCRLNAGREICVVTVCCFVVGLAVPCHTLPCRRFFYVLHVVSCRAFVFPVDGMVVALLLLLLFFCCCYC